MELPVPEGRRPASQKANVKSTSEDKHTAGTSWQQQTTAGARLGGL